MFDATKWQPMKDKVLVRRLEPETRTASGLYLGKTRDLVDSTRGVVLAIGPKVTDVSVGDIVEIGPWADRLCLDDQHAILPEDEVRWKEGARRRLKALAAS